MEIIRKELFALVSNILTVATANDHMKTVSRIITDKFEKDNEEQ